VGPGASYYTLTTRGAPIGYVSSTIDTSPASITVQNNTVLDVQALGSVQQAAITVLAQLSRQFQLQSFEASFTSMGGGQPQRYRASGRAVGDSVLEVEIDAGGTRPQRQRIRLDRPLVLPEMVNLRLAVGGVPQRGRSYRLRMFDPLLMQERDIEMTVLAESTMVFPDSASWDAASQLWVPARWDTVRAFKVVQTYGGLSMESWIDEQGHIVSATSPIGFRMERTAFEIAVENYRLARRRGAFALAPAADDDIIEQTAIASDPNLRPENLAELRVRLLNVELGGFDLSGGRQRLSGDTLTVTRESGLGRGGGTPPALYERRLPLSSGGDTSIARALVPEPLVQSDDPRIEAQARRIVGNERRAGRVAELLNSWVYQNLEKRITISVPSAAQVLETRSGDCNEHTVLYVALARSLGLPTRTAAGVVYLRGRFFYHAWPEVWLGEWVAVDPTFGQFPADAAHLRFVIGGLARQVELVRLIGRLRLEVLR
jgi:transglutaminase-like putative cysteine protease